MDYVPGGELYTHLHMAKKFNESKSRFYLAELVLALEYIHSTHTIYRDLKPENILLDRQGHI